MQPFERYGCSIPCVNRTRTLSPVATLAISAGGSGRALSELLEPVFGGYANARGEIVLFGKELAYRVNFKKQTLQQRPQLNRVLKLGTTQRCRGQPLTRREEDVPPAGNEQIIEICTSGRFKPARYLGKVRGVCPDLVAVSGALLPRDNGS